MRNNNSRTSGGLKKSITFLEALCIVVGMIIGSGVFLKPGVVLGEAGTPVLAIFAWIIGGVVTLASALSIAEIAAAIPKTGGLYTYLQELYGDVWGWLLGWVQTVVSYPASVAVQAIAFATYANLFWPMSDMAQKLLGIGVLAFLLCMNILSTKYGGVIQTIATFGKLLPIVALIGFGLFSNAVPNFTQSGQAMGATGFGAAILGTLWAYEGWIGVTNMAGELKNPAKQLPKVIFIGVSFVILVYALFNLAIFRVLPYETVVASTTPGAQAATVLFGEKGAALITAGIMVSVFGALNGFLMTAARVPLAMGQQGNLPFSRALSQLHPRFSTPCNALVLESVLAVVYILSGSFHMLTDLLVFVLWIFFTMGVFGVFILRKRFGKAQAGYKVPLYPITPVVGILGSAFILVSTMVSNPLNSLLGIGITLIGIPVYFWISRKRTSR